MVSKMATHYSPKQCHVLTLGKFYNITHTEKYILHRKSYIMFLSKKILELSSMRS